MSGRSDYLTESTKPIADTWARRTGTLKMVLSAGVLAFTRLSQKDRERLLAEAAGDNSESPCKPECFRCLFFQDFGVEKQLGECRRYAPPVEIKNPIHAKPVKKLDENAIWPIVSFDSWCGEFEAASKAQVQERYQRQDSYQAAILDENVAAGRKKGRKRTTHQRKSSESD